MYKVVWEVLVCRGGRFFTKVKQAFYPNLEQAFSHAAKAKVKGKVYC